MYKYSLLVILTGILLTACSPASDYPIFRKLEVDDTRVEFKNIITESDSVNVVSFTNIYNGGGIGVADFNKDGFPDLFFTGNMVSCQLYLNRTKNGKIRFENISEPAGINTDRWATGVSVADINSDGWPDIYVSVSGSHIKDKRQNYLFIHQGLNDDQIPYFKEMAREYGLDDKTYSTQSAFLDYDKDNDLDLFIAVNFADQFYGATVNIPTPNKKGYTDRSDRLYENTGIGKDGHPVFTDVSVKAGILHEGYSLGMVVQDINMDGWPDIYQANDFLSNDILYMNQGDGTFINKIGDYFKHTTFAGMGMDISDFNNDGRLDIFVLDMTPADNLRQKSMMLPTQKERFMLNLKAGYYPQYNRNTLQLNNGFKPDGDMSFSEIGQLSNVHHTDWSWTVLFGDYNNSGYRDLMVCNGFRRDLQDIDNIHYLFGDNPFGTREHWEQQFVRKVKDISGIYVNNFLLENNGDLTFTDQSESWGFKHPSYSNGGIFADLDNDGDLDVVINNLDEHPFIYENIIRKPGNKNSQGIYNYLKIHFPGNILDGSNIGTELWIDHGDKMQYHQHYVVRGYLSSLDPVVHFGLGSDTIVHSIKIKWPDGSCQEIRNVAANQDITLQKNSITCDSTRAEGKLESVFKNVSKEIDLDHRHKEFEYDDFIFQMLLIQGHATNGPGIAAADVDLDDKEDFVVGGARGQGTIIFIQQESGQFVKKDIDGSEPFEDIGLLFFDAESDGDPDLYIVSGSSEYGQNRSRTKDRLYINDGQGNFESDSAALPEVYASGSCVLSADFDGDGDEDLFVGGRVSPKEYPKIPESYLLLNESDKNGVRFVDITESWSSEMKNIGMVTGGLFTDFNNDQLVDLILVGEWMPICLFMNTGSSFTLLSDSAGLQYSHGWWNSIQGGDFDKDGDMDYLAGNLGLNSWLKATRDEPISMYADDYDQDGKIDPLLFHFVHGKNVPFHSRDLLVNQLSFLRRKFPTYADFAKADLNDILDEVQRKQSLEFFAYELRSSYIENLGNNRFKMRPLDISVQVSPMFGILIDDFDDDGFFDAIMAGNSKASNLTLGWYDASIGYFLKGKGDGTFEIKDGTRSGFYVDTDAKGIVQLGGINSEPVIVVANNDDSLSVFNRVSVPSHTLELPPGGSSGRLIYKDGSSQKIEFYNGGGYLSGQGRTLFLGRHVKSILVYDPSNRLLQEVSFD